MNKLATAKVLCENYLEKTAKPAWMKRAFPGVTSRHIAGNEVTRRITTLRPDLQDAFQKAQKSVAFNREVNPFPQGPTTSFVSLARKHNWKGWKQDIRDYSMSSLGNPFIVGPTNKLP